MNDDTEEDCLFNVTSPWRESSLGHYEFNLDSGLEKAVSWWNLGSLCSFIAQVSWEVKTYAGQ